LLVAERQDREIVVEMVVAVNLMLVLVVVVLVALVVMEILLVVLVEQDSVQLFLVQLHFMLVVVEDPVDRLEYLVVREEAILVEMVRALL
jgi:hypothetical protein